MWLQKVNSDQCKLHLIFSSPGADKQCFFNESLIDKWREKIDENANNHQGTPEYERIESLIGGANLFSIQPFEPLNETCNCEMEITVRRRAVIKCSWAINEIATYLSLTASTFSIAYAVIQNGYVDFSLDNACCGLSKVTLYLVYFS